MSIEAVAEANRSSGVIATAPWRIRNFSILPGYRIAVTFNDGTSGVADLSGLKSSRNCGIFEALKDPAYFDQASLELGVVTWPNGADLDPAWMHEEMGSGKTWSVPI